MIRAIQFQNKRVGSTFLQNAINSHTDIIGIDEVFVNVSNVPIERGKKSGFIPFVRSDVDTPKDYIEDIINRTYPDNNTIFKLMYNQIGYHQGLEGYIKNNNIPIILVLRKNTVKQIISWMNAASNKHIDIKKVFPNFSVPRLVREVKEADRLNELWKKRLKDQIKLVLYYEDIIGKTEGDRTYLTPLANIAICDFFKVPQQQLYATTKKKNKEDLSVYIQNYDEVIKAFKGTKYEWML